MSDYEDPGAFIDSPEFRSAFADAYASAPPEVRANVDGAAEYALKVYGPDGSYQKLWDVQ